jgi:hypothetical protein
MFAHRQTLHPCTGPVVLSYYVLAHRTPQWSSLRHDDSRTEGGCTDGAVDAARRRHSGLVVSEGCFTGTHKTACGWNVLFGMAWAYRLTGCSGVRFS